MPLTIHIISQFTKDFEVYVSISPHCDYHREIRKLNTNELVSPLVSLPVPASLIGNLKREITLNINVMTLFLLFTLTLCHKHSCQKNRI